MRIDAHQHFWAWQPGEYPWMTDDIAILKQDYLPLHLQPSLRDNGMHGCIAVQARQSLAENDFLLELKRSHDFIKGVVGWVDLAADDVTGKLGHYGRHLCGIRHQVHDEPDVEFMLGKDFQRGISELRHHGLVYDLLIRPEHLANTIELADAHPAQSFVVDHLGKPDIAAGQLEPWASQIKELSKRENVTCKLSGMVTEADFSNWDDEEVPADSFLPFIDVALSSFGPERLMYGSDWPVCTLAATWDEVYDIVNDAVLKLSPAEQEAIMGETAARIYGLK